MNSIKIIHYLKLFLTIALAFLATIFLSKEVFIADSPQIRPNLGEYMLAQLKDLQHGNFDSLAGAFDRRTPEEKLKNAPLLPVFKGVYAKSDKNTSYTVINEKEVDWVQYTFVVNGKTIQIKVPKGDSPPSQELVEKIYK